MRSILLCSLLVVLLGFTSCVQSIQPFFEEKDVYFDRSLVGTWSERDGKETWKLEQRGDKEYLVDQTEDGGKRTLFHGRLFKIGDRSFIDLVPTRSGEMSGQLRAVHTFFAIKREGCTSRISFLDGAWLKGFLSANPNAVGHTNVDGEIVLTDSTKNLQSFIKQHLDTPGAYEETETLSKKGDTQCS